MRIWKSCRCWGVREGRVVIRGMSTSAKTIHRRPQYDDSAIAVIITKQEKAKKYEKMISGEEVLESWLENHKTSYGGSILIS